MNKKGKKGKILKVEKKVGSGEVTG